ncbi:MAG: lipopolysaccharide biosynthesis protein [Planctomycetes bacterium]|nr:lipopolysaccharide biosynthesis protein [Planctomycetota bacterium]
MLTAALKRLTQHSFVYALGPAVHKVIGFLILPLVTVWIGSRGNYGVVEMASVTLAIAAQVLGINLLQGMARYYASYDTEADRRALVGTCVLILLGTTGVAFLFAWCFRAAGAELLFGSREYADALVLAAGILVAQSVSQVGLRWLQLLERSTLYGVVTTLKLLLETGLKVWFLAGLGLTYMGVLYSVLCGELVVALGVGVVLVARTKLAFSRAMAKRLWTYSSPLLFSGLCGFVLHQGDRFFVLQAGGEDQVGLYGLAYKLGSIGNTVVFEAFALIWYPFVFAVKDDESVRRIIRAVLVYFTLLLAFVTLGLALFSPEIVRVMADERFFEAHTVLPLVAGGYLAWGVYQVVGTVFYLRERTWLVSALVAGAAALNFALNAFLVPRHGYVGAAWATLATFACLAGAAWIVAERTWRIGHETLRVLAPIVLAAGLFVGARAGAEAAPAHGLAIRTLGVLLLPGILAVGGYLNRQEKDKLWEFARRGVSTVFRRR